MTNATSAISLALLTLIAGSAMAGNIDFSEEELSVAEFWAQMGPTLRDQGIAAYAIRYHDDFRHWDIKGTGRFSSKESAIRYYTKFHSDGHRITCTYVKPVTIDIIDDYAIARLVYEETITFADGAMRTGVWRMVDVFKRRGDTWQVLESNMVDITPGPGAAGDVEAYEFHCPASVENPG